MQPIFVIAGYLLLIGMTAKFMGNADTGFEDEPKGSIVWNEAIRKRMGGENAERNKDAQ